MPLSRPIRSETTWPSTTKDEACGSDWTYATPGICSQLGWDESWAQWGSALALRHPRSYTSHGWSRCATLSPCRRVEEVHRLQHPTGFIWSCQRWDRFRPGSLPFQEVEWVWYVDIIRRDEGKGTNHPEILLHAFYIGNNGTSNNIIILNIIAK